MSSYSADQTEKQKTEKQNEPPNVKCNPNFTSPIYAQKGQDYTIVEWTAESWDNDGIVSKQSWTPNNIKTGMNFTIGNYEVTYTAIDDKGAINSCTMKFEVKVRTCQPLKSIGLMGIPNCDSPSRIYGSKCYMTCNEGYSYPSKNVFECQSDGQWYPFQVEKCKANQCQPKPSITNGAINCNGTPLYEDVCGLTCNDGYSLVNGSSRISCNANGTWETTGTCKDSEPPKFTDCPNGNKLVYVDAPNNTASVTWNVPTGTDNSGIAPTITEKNMYIPGMRFMAGTHVVNYDITDSVGNVGISCQFELQVASISCDFPSINNTGSEHLLYHCSDKLRIGAHCNVSCNFGYPQGGAKTIHCLNDGNIYPPMLRWEWDKNELKPYCEVIKCPKLRAPENGALACADWAHGEMCQIQCQDGYDVLFELDGHFVCGQSDGIWRPNQDVVDCRLGCPPGKYYSVETENCVNCEISTYQDESSTISCKPCPENYVTKITGSKTSTDCIEMCVPGSFSQNGLAPCQLCPSSSYQPAKNQTSCLPCAKGSRTTKGGSTNVDDCLVFDLSIDAMKPAKLVFDRTAEEITVFTWIHLKGDYKNQPTFEIVSSSKDHYLVKITFNTSIVVNINGRDANFPLTIPSQEWTPIALTISGRTQRIGIHATIDGSVFDNNSHVSFQRRAVFKNGDIFKANPGIIISAFHIWDKVVSSSEIKELLSTCTPDEVVSTYSLSDFVISSGTAYVITPSLCDDINECTNKPCGEHTCINKLGGYECKCHGGFTGKNCEIPKNYCLGNACQNNALCINGQAGYTCRCLYGYRGRLCGIKAVDGGWSTWTEWTTCSKTCGGGYSNRERYCNSPSHDPEGSPCEGSNNETIVCNSQKCPECIRLATTSDVLASCNETGHSTRCTIYCRPGLFFSSTPLPIYECGWNTNYTWNPQTDENPSGRLPSCTEVLPPTELGVSFDGHYESVTCTPDNVEAVKSSVGSSLSSLECVQHGSCSASIMPRNCLENEEQLSNGITFTVELKSSVKSDGSGYNIAETIANNAEPSSDLKTFVKNIIELEKSAQILINDSKDLFEVTVNGEKHTVMKDEFTFTLLAKCLPGSIRLNGLCAECPVGSYSNGEKVIMCPIGRYQDEKGQTSCKKCPMGYITDSIGSVSISECFENPHRSTVDIVVGGYTEWSIWSTCTLTCGDGTQSRTRHCTNPAPQYGGANCSGHHYENQACNEQICPRDNQTKNIDWGHVAVGIVTVAGVAVLVAITVCWYKRKQKRKTYWVVADVSTLYSELQRPSELEVIYKEPA